VLWIGTSVLLLFLLFVQVEANQVLYDR
jgi:hypothetical protein